MDSKITRIEDFPIDNAHRHDLPFPGLPSRISTAILLCFKGLKVEVIKKMLVLSKRGRVFIITQHGLSGFLLSRHNNCKSWIFDCILTDSVESDARYKLSNVKQIYDKLLDVYTEEELEAVLFEQ